jgi:hypothetical protein
MQNMITFFEGTENRELQFSLSISALRSLIFVLFLFWKRNKQKETAPKQKQPATIKTERKTIATHNQKLSCGKILS